MVERAEPHTGPKPLMPWNGEKQGHMGPKLTWHKVRHPGRSTSNSNLEEGTRGNTWTRKPQWTPGEGGMKGRRRGGESSTQTTHVGNLSRIKKPKLEQRTDRIKCDGTPTNDPKKQGKQKTNR